MAQRKPPFLVISLSILSLLALPACGNKDGKSQGTREPQALHNQAAHAPGSKCTPAIDKMGQMALDAARQMSVAVGEERDAQLQAMQQEIRRSAEKATAKCEAAMEQAARLDRTLDCILEASDMDAVSRCDGADALMVTSQGDKCSQAMDKMIAYMKSGEMEVEIRKMVAELPEDARKEAEVEIRRQLTRMDGLRPQIVARCQADLRDEEKGAKTERELDCVLASATMEQASRCMD